MIAVPPPPPGRDPRTRRWPMSVVRKARLLYQGGWTVKEIIDLIEREHGARPSRTTIRCWAEPGFADEHRQINTRAQARRRVRQGLPTVVETEAPVKFGENLMWELRVKDRLSYSAIGKVTGRIFGVPLTEEQVRHRLHRLGVPKDPSRVRSAHLLNERKAAA